MNFRTKVISAVAAVIAATGLAWATQTINDALVINGALTQSNGAVSVAGPASFTSTLAVTGVYTATGGVAPPSATFAYNASGINTCAAGGIVTTQGTDTTPSVTETYVAEINIPANTTVTGIAILNGSAAAGNVTVWLAGATGVTVASSATTAQSGTAAYQRIPLSAPYSAIGPGGYFIAVQFDNTGARFRSHVNGNCDAGKITGTVYGTLVSFTAPTTFTASLGPVAGLY